MPPEDFANAFLPKGASLAGRKLSLKEANALYDSEILYMDHYIGKFLQKLKTYDLYDNTLIIVTSDHGELIGEHGKFGHGDYLYQQELHVPLLLKYPGGEVSPNRTSMAVQMNDIFAMVLKRLEIDLPQGIQAGIPPQIGHPLLAETYPLASIRPDGHWRAIFEGDFKFVWNSKGHHMLFHLVDDPGELVNLATYQSERSANMLSKMSEYLAKLPPPGPALPAQELDEDTTKALKSLGYVD
jgi:arylsulfatase A-like enzyme